MNKWLIILLFCANLQAAPLDKLHPIGSGEMSYLFWTLYRAEFFAATQPYRVDEDTERALRIEYYREIDKDDLVRVTLEQWLHLGYDQQLIRGWQSQLESLWPNVMPGDRLTLVVKQEGVSEFYFGDELLGRIQDVDFGEAFLDIWLSQHTTEPELRQALLGLRQ